MARVNNLTNFLTDVSSAIKQKTGDNTPIPASEFDTEILSIETGGNYQSKTLNVTQNGNYNLLPDQEFDALSNVNISVSVSPVLQNKTITENGSYSADSGYDGLGTVIVNVPSGSGDIKLFETEQAMQADPNPSEGDLAVVYREEIQPVTEESEFDSCIFPNTVVLDEAFTGEIYGRFRAVDDDVWFDGSVNMSSSRFEFNGWGESSQIRVEYSSPDGITYTRTDGGDETIDFGTDIKFEAMMEPWNDVFGQFMKIGGSVFEGIYEYNLDVVDKDNIWFARTNDISFDYNGSSISNVVCSNPYFESISTNSIVKIFNYLKLNANIDSNLISVARKSDGKLIVLAAYSLDSNSYRDYGLQYMGYDANKNYLGLISDWNSSNTQIHYWVINEETFELQSIVPTVLNAQLSVIKNYAGFSLNLQTVVRTYSYMNNSFVGSLCIVCGNSTQTVKQYIDNVAGKDCIYKKYDKYVISVNQLDATSEYVYGKEFYGKNGVENGTLTQAVSNSFADVNAEVYAKIQEQYDNMQPRVLTDNDKSIDTKLYFIPTKFDGTPLLDTSNVTDMSNMFSSCKNLINIPLLDTSSATNMKYMFISCENLTTVSNFNTSNVTNMYGLFTSCENLTTVPNFNTSNVTNMQYMFSSCKNLTTVPNFNTSNVTNMQYMFNGCTSLTSVSQLDTSNVTNMYSMFRYCTSLTSVPQFDTSNVTDMGNVFNGCTSLISVPQFDTSKVTNMSYMFDGCNSLSNESLNNILAMCINAVKVTSYKTLKGIGLTEEQANICKTLSNYQDFVNAGWTTGY